MSDKEGTLVMQPSQRWAVCRPGREPVEITFGEIFRVEVDGQLQVRRMEHAPGRGYYLVGGPPLRGGMRAAVGEEDGPMTSKEVEITFRVQPEQAPSLLEFLRCCSAITSSALWTRLKK